MIWASCESQHLQFTKDGKIVPDEAVATMKGESLCSLHTGREGASTQYEVPPEVLNTRHILLHCSPTNLGHQFSMCKRYSLIGPLHFCDISMFLNS